jgi:hypothetical protein
MSDNQRKILEMLADEKISVDEAERLMSLTQGEPASSGAKGNKNAPRYLRVLIKPTTDSNECGECETVNVRVPMSLLRAGIKLTSLIPPSAYSEVNSALKQKGLNFDLRDIKPENLEEIIGALGELEVTIQDGKQDVRVYAE